VTEIRTVKGFFAKRTLFSMLVATVAMVLALAGCGDDNKSTTGAAATTTDTTATTETTPSGKVNDEGSANLAADAGGEVELDDFYFKPTTIEGNPGQTLTLDLYNEGKVEHNFALAQQKIDKDLAPDQRASVEVKVPKSGSVRFICKYHAGQGMVGSLQAAGSGSSGGSSGDNSGKGSGSSGDDTTTTNTNTTESGGGGGY
jgi:plastocyanin